MIEVCVGGRRKVGDKETVIYHVARDPRRNYRETQVQSRSCVMYVYIIAGM